MEPHEASVLGTAVAFAVVVLTCYYWVMLLLVPLGRGRWGPTAAWLALNSALFAGHYIYRNTLSFEALYGLFSWALAAYLLAWLVPDAWTTAQEAWRRTKRAAFGSGGGE
jgi:hypothetical protein